MALEKVTVIDRIELVESGLVQVCTAARVKAICAARHTPEVIAAYEAIQEAKQAKIET